MLSSDLKTVVAPLKRVMMIIWGAFISATIIYFFLAWFMFGRETGGTIPDAAATPSAMAP